MIIKSTGFHKDISGVGSASRDYTKSLKTLNYQIAVMAM